MPQLDILLLSSQYVTGTLFIIGFIYFSKVAFPYISFFVKLENIRMLKIYDLFSRVSSSYSGLFILRKNIFLKLRKFSKLVTFLNKSVLVSSTLIFF